MARKALLVANEMRDRAGFESLAGCANDVDAIRDMLTHYFDFLGDEIHFLVNEQARRTAILEELAWLARGAAPGDVLIFHYSGPASFVPDDNGDEADCRDECLITADGDWNQPLRDDDIRTVLNRIPSNATLITILDTCRANSGARRGHASPRFQPAPPAITMQVETLRRNMIAAVRAGQIIAPTDRSGASGFNLAKAVANHVLLAACQANEVAWEDVCEDEDGKRVRGIFTHHLINTVKAARGQLTYRQLIETVQQRIQAEAASDMNRIYGQTPVLDCAAKLQDVPIFRPLP